jgi:tRNA pseudouridine38-40 synthase
VTVFRLVIEYDGTNFSGWQTQPGRRTVQGVLEQALFVMLKTPIRLQGAGRTDAGVHALGQVASFEADTDIIPERLRKGLCALARPDVSVVEAKVAPLGFNARFDALGKHYRYAIFSRPSPSPLRSTDRYFVPQPLNLDAMRTAASFLVGEHDFAAFRAKDCERETTVRRLSEVSVTEIKDDLFIDVKGDAFLKNMVRIIAGTLVDVGRGRLALQSVQEALRTGDRTAAGRTAPPNGLTLISVFYPIEWIRPRLER